MADETISFEVKINRLLFLVEKIWSPSDTDWQVPWFAHSKMSSRKNILHWL